jgi:hypothetical protein
MVCGVGGGVEPITNYRIKHVDTHFFIVVDKILQLSTKC